MNVFLARDQGLVAIAGEEEPPLLCIAKLVNHDLGETQSRVNPVGFAGRFIQPCQAVNQVGVVVEIGVELGFAILVSVEQASVGEPHLVENKVGGPPRGLEVTFVLEDAPPSAKAAIIRPFHETKTLVSLAGGTRPSRTARSLELLAASSFWSSSSSCSNSLAAWLVVRGKLRMLCSSQLPCSVTS